MSGPVLGKVISPAVATTSRQDSPERAREAGENSAVGLSAPELAQGGSTVHSASIATSRSTYSISNDPSHQKISVDRDDETRPALPSGISVSSAEQQRAMEENTGTDMGREFKKEEDAGKKLLGEEVERTIVDGLEDDKVWMMLRRFNYQINQVLSPPRSLPVGEPDLRSSPLPDVPFNSDGLKSNAERVYATFGVSGIFFAREMMRLMDWSPGERKRTGAFCATYFAACYFSMAIRLIVSLLMLLVIYPPSRLYLFPPVIPLAGQNISATDPTSKSGDESLLAGVESPTTKRSKSEQAEEQSQEFMTFVERFGMKAIVGGARNGSNGKQGNAGVGKKEDHSSSEKSDEEDTENRNLRPAVEESNGGEAVSEKEEKKVAVKVAKEKRDKMVGEAAKATQDALGDLGLTLWRDVIRYYPRTSFRIKLVGFVLFPIFTAFAIVPAHVWAQIFSFTARVAFFGHPVIKWSARKFVRLVPGWPEYLDLRNSIFSGVPTDAQVVLLILRSHERVFNPLSPPPDTPTASDTKQELSNTSVDPNFDDGTDDDSDNEEGNSDLTHRVGDRSKKAVKQGGGKILGGLRKAVKKVATIGADVKEADETKAEGEGERFGSMFERVFHPEKTKDEGSPESYPAKLKDTFGHLILQNAHNNTSSTVSFVSLHTDSLKFKAPISSLVELQKEGVWIARAALGWAAATKIEGTGVVLRFK